MAKLINASDRSLAYTPWAIRLLDVESHRVARVEELTECL